MMIGGAADKPCVLVAAARADWEPAVLAALSQARMVVLRRCVDIVDLLGTASAGAADVAVVAADLDGVDSESLRELRGCGVAVVAIGDREPDLERLTRLGVATVSGASGVVAAVEASLATRTPAAAGPDDAVAADDRDEGFRGRVVAVWGAAGAPGRSTVAAALAAERALANRVTLCDLDPYAGTLAQSLGVLDEVSGLLAAARAANEGALDGESLRAALRSVSPGLDLLTGLPRPERWLEVRPGVVESLIAIACRRGDVVLDCGFGAGSDDAAVAPSRINAEALAGAEQIVVVGSAEPAALSRLARALVELDTSLGTGNRGGLFVVINRMRATLGWRTDDIVSMVTHVAPGARVSFWPYDRASLDRAALKGVALPALGETPLRDGARELLGELFDQVPNNR
ncbi:MAG TPA: hypothetical protein VF426_05130 [Marmoricola sp.]